MTAFIVTATDTGLGKTVVASMLVRALGAYYWKPVQAGITGGTDLETVAQLSGAPPHKLLPEAYRLGTPVSPHLAAELDGTAIDVTRLVLPACDGPLIIEGAGGLLVPLSRTLLQIEVFRSWNVPLILCARTELGTINHSLLSLEALRSRAVPLRGIVFIGEENRDSQETIAAMGNATVLGRLPILDRLTSESLAGAFKENFRLEDFQ